MENAYDRDIFQLLAISEFVLQWELHLYMRFRFHKAQIIILALLNFPLTIYNRNPPKFPHFKKTLTAFSPDRQLNFYCCLDQGPVS